VFGFSATAVYDLSDTMQLKSISGYRQISGTLARTWTVRPRRCRKSPTNSHQWQVSQEFQLLGKALDNRLNYVGGLYYLKEHGYVHDFVPFEALLFVDDSRERRDQRGLCGILPRRLSD